MVIVITSMRLVEIKSIRNKLDWGLTFFFFCPWLNIWSQVFPLDSVCHISLRGNKTCVTDSGSDHANNEMSKRWCSLEKESWRRTLLIALNAVQGRVLQREPAIRYIFSKDEGLMRYDSGRTWRCIRFVRVERRLKLKYFVWFGFWSGLCDYNSQRAGLPHILEGG